MRVCVHVHKKGRIWLNFWRVSIGVGGFAVCRLSGIDFVFRGSIIRAFNCFCGDFECVIARSFRDPVRFWDDCVVHSEL